MERLSRDGLFASAALAEDLYRKSSLGGFVMLVSQALKITLRFGGTVVLARLLTPYDYGVIAMVTVLTNFIALFKDAGLSIATVQAKEITHEQVSTLFWINFLISCGLGVLILASAPVVSLLYGNSDVAGVTAVLSFSFILSGMVLQHDALLRRHLRFGIIAVVQIFSQVIMIVVTVCLAYQGFRYWALVVGLLTNSVVQILCYLYFCPWIPGQPRKNTGARKKLAFGLQLTGSRFLNYFATNADNFLIGRYIGGDALGIYNRAYSLFMVPVYQIQGPITSVSIPVLSALVGNQDRFKRYFSRILDIIAYLTIPLGLYCAVEAEFIIGLLLGPQWMNAVPVFRLLSLAGLLFAVSEVRSLVLISHGYTDRLLKFNIVNSALTVVAFIIGLRYGIVGIAIGFSVAQLIVLFPSLKYCFFKTPATLGLFFKSVYPPLLCSMGSLIISFCLYYLVGDTSLVMHLVFGIVYGVCYLGLSHRLPIFKVLIQLLRKHVLRLGN